MGLAGYYRRFVKDFSRIAKPLNDLTNKGTRFSAAAWGPDQVAAFATLKDCLVSAPVLAYPDFTKPFRLAVDSSDWAGGAVLQQLNDEGIENPVAYWSMTYTDGQRHYGATEKECLALVEAVRHFRPYLYGKPFELLTDHSALT